MTAVACMALAVIGLLAGLVVWLVVSRLEPLLHDLVAELRRIRQLAESERD